MYHSALFTVSNTGLQVYTLPFTPTKARFTVVNGQQWSTGEATNSASQISHSSSFDVTPTAITDDTTKCINLQKRVSGVLQPDVVASFHSFGSNRFRLNVLNSNASIQVFGEFET